MDRVLRCSSLVVPLLLLLAWVGLASQPAPSRAGVLAEDARVPTGAIAAADVAAPATVEELRGCKANAVTV